MRKSNWIAVLSLVAVGAFAAGCGGGSSTTVECSARVPCDGTNEQCVNGKCVVVANPDGGVQTDGGQQQDGPAVTCDNTGFTPVFQSLNFDYADQGIVLFDAYSAETEPYDDLSFEFWDTLVTGTITLGSSAAEKNYKTCTTCVLVYQGCTADGCAKTFFATSGTVAVTADGATPGTHFTATLTNAQFVEVTIASDYTSTPVAGGETWCIPSQALDAMNGCATSDDCAAGVCDTGSNTCVECLVSNDCVGSTYGPVCDPESNYCVGCLSNTDCSGTTPKCDVGYQECVECLVNADCAGNAHGTFCSGMNTCGACATAFDCTAAAAPACIVDPNDDTRAACGVLAQACTGDDTAENNNDGPAGAVELTSTAVAAKICERGASTETTDLDFFKFTAANTTDATVRLTWTVTAANPEDLDLAVYDSQGRQLGLAWWGNGVEEIALSYLPAGTYYAVVNINKRTSTTAATLTDYAIVLNGVASTSCAADADCSNVYAHQILRGKCNTTSHACELIDGAGAVANGGSCDSPDDCTSGLCTYGMSDGYTSYEYFKAAGRAFCVADTCATNADCNAAANEVCSLSFCQPKCTESAQCPVDEGDATVGADGWARAVCNTTTGICAFP